MKKSLDYSFFEEYVGRLNDLWENENWQKVNHHDKTNGLSQKAVNSYRREHPGSKLQTAVTTKPSKLKAGSKAAKRRKSFCARMSGNKGPMKKPNGKPTPKALALRRWNCESIEEMRQLIEYAEQEIAREKMLAESSKNSNTTAQKIFFARSNKAPKGWSYDHVGFITQDGRQIQMSGHKGNDVYVTNDVTDDPEFPKQNIKIVSLSKPVSIPTTNSVGAENCGTFVANVLQANGIKGIDTQKIYSVFKQPHKQDVSEGGGAQQAAIAIAKRESGKYTKDGKRKK